ncbi:hypothetical protein BY996DRAFT_6547813 [Phakopsora pachyrhizi]|nr:hypothetical protein BY996DRAFT_6547813 [Phakopsora pachyrhizi]
MPVKKDQRNKGRNRRKGDVDIAGPTTAKDILQGRRRKALCRLYGVGRRRKNRPLQGQRRQDTLWRNWDCLTNKEAVGREEAGGRPEEVSVELVRRRETPRRPIEGLISGGISKAVLSDFDIGRRRHTEVRSSYHFRVRAKDLHNCKL